MLGVLSCEDGLICMDCHLDHLDLGVAIGHGPEIKVRLANGCSAAFVTSRPDIVQQCDSSWS